MVRKMKILNMLLVLSLVFLLTSGCKLTKQQQQEEQPPPASTYNPEALYNTSGHADETAEAFIHWDEDDPPMVPTGCAKCHSNDGFIDFVDNGVVDNAANPGVIGCTVCHVEPASGSPRGFNSVLFPSGITVTGLGSEALCMQCHQGRYSGPGVDSYIAGRGIVGEDTVSSSLSFRNIHYFAAGASMLGTLAKGGYQYAGRTYDGRFGHVEGYTSCSDCHDPHSLQVKTEECSRCHSEVAASGSGLASAQSSGLHAIRHYGSHVDYDGDGNITEGIHYEIETLQGYLFDAMWRYSLDVTGTAIGYDAHAYPYFFKDNNQNGTIDPSEANYGNQYRSYTPRLLKAAYNYQVSQKDPGGFAHGGKYIIQLLYDSLMDINGAAPNPVTLPGLKRGDEGHFNGSTEAWRHWDEDGEVSGSCAKCHSASGLPDFLAYGENEASPISNGLLCSTCHTSVPALRQNDVVTFPSGAMLSMPDGSNLCLNCHQGRASKSAVDSKIAASGGTGKYSFTNIHYFPAAAVLFGSEAQGGYEYQYKTYTGKKTFAYHGDSYDTCIECHMGTKGHNSNTSHNVMKPNPADCVECHGRDDAQPYPGYDAAKFTFDGIRPASVPDYDGDGNMTESIKAEIQGLEAALYAQMQAYGFATGNPILYDSHAYPYFFKDKNGNGLVDPGEAIYPNSYSFDATLLKAAYNYQLSLKEPHGFIHNSLYVAQLLVDSIEDLGGNVSAYTWR